MNCPNCAAPLNPYQSKCEYCGSYFIDATVFDLDNFAPTFLKMKYKGQIVTLKAFHCSSTIQIESDYTDITDRYGNTVKCLYRDKNMHLTLEADCQEISVEN